MALMTERLVKAQHELDNGSASCVKQEDKALSVDCRLTYQLGTLQHQVWGLDAHCPLHTLPSAHAQLLHVPNPNFKGQLLSCLVIKLSGS